MDGSPHDERRRRGRIAQGVAAVVLAGLAAGFFHTQVLRGPAPGTRSSGYRLHAITMPAPRGVILDREGRPLAENRPAYMVSIVPGPTDSTGAALERLAPLLGLSPADVARLADALRRDPHAMLTVTDDASPDELSRIEENRSAFPGVLIEPRPRRRYPAGRAAAHVIGYVDRLDPPDGPTTRARGVDRVVGRSGVEARYDNLLAGRPGLRYVEVDRHGHVMEGPVSAPRAPPAAGETVKLSLDLPLQHLLESLLPDTVRGGVAVIEPGSGEVVALYSSPSFDPNDLTGRSPPARAEWLVGHPLEPLRDRATGTVYAAGTVWQPVTAAIALELGVIGPGRLMPVSCRGGMPYAGRYLHCRDPGGHGALDLVGALRVGCDVYFYQLGLQLGLHRLATEGVRTGFGRRTGIDLPDEATGGIRLAPDSAAGAGLDEQAAFLAAGAGPTEASALQLAHFFAAVMVPGGAPGPRLRRSTDAASDFDRVDPGFNAGTRAALRAGLRRDRARAAPFPRVLPEDWEWLGAAGRAAGGDGSGHRWFVGLAGPADGAPDLVVAAVIEGGGPDPAMIAARVLDHRVVAGSEGGPDR